MVSRRCALWIAAAVFAPLAIALTITAVTLADSKTTGVVVKTADANSLYKRLGGYDAIAAVTDDFIARLVTDKRLGLGITEDDWTRASAAMKVTLDKFNVGAKEQAELFAIIGPPKPDIVGR